MDVAEVMEVLRDAAGAVRVALDGLADWGPTGDRPGQYRSDLAADAACLSVLDEAGVGWLSEESGAEHTDRDVVVIVDPVDGSTNAGRGLPWYATSLCAVDARGPLAALVVNQASGVAYDAVRGAGARRDGATIAPSGRTDLARCVVGISGYPRRPLGWAQFRALGAVALDLCAVADGTLDGYVDFSVDAHGAWDYAAGLLVCREAGAVVTDAFDRDLVSFDHDQRRTPVAAATVELARTLSEGRRSLRSDDDRTDAGGAPGPAQ